MAENQIDIKSLRDLVGKKFFIPCYQRGYRWTERNVKDLLNDIFDFTFNKKKRDGEFYCLQPLVVKEMSPDEMKLHNLPAGETWYEVVDGQQRLTTLYLILSAKRSTLEDNNIMMPPYELKYERTTGADSYLNNLDKDKGDKPASVDVYFLHKAYSCIKDWFTNFDKQKTPSDYVLTYIRTNKSKDEKRREIDEANNVRVIWYELADEDPVEVFTRLNIGKIALTNSELVKALLLNSSNFKEDKEYHTILLRQQEMASVWDEIELTLQNDNFWLFIHGKDYDKPTRIDFILELVMQANELKLDEDELNEVGDDENAIFRYFYTYFKRKNAGLEECWKIIKGYFDVICEWYEDVEIYHYLGFLFANEQNRDKSEARTIETLTKQKKCWNQSSEKSDFVRTLKAHVLSVVKAIPLDKQYKVDGSDKRDCWPVLLFHNIQTSINMNKIGKSGEFEDDDKLNETVYKFPFNLFKSEGWDVEHINSNTTNDESEAKTRNEWLLSVYLGVDESVREKIENYFSVYSLDTEGVEATRLYKEIKDTVKMPDDWTEEEKNRIWNYALLDSSTNRSYGNAIFSGKRRIIISKDRGIEVPLPQLNKSQNILVNIGEKPRKASSCFVPPCTKYVFLKYYSPSINHVNYWTKEMDAPAYLEDIKRCIAQLDDKNDTENGK